MAGLCMVRRALSLCLSSLLLKTSLSWQTPRHRGYIRVSGDKANNPSAPEVTRARFLVGSGLDPDAPPTPLMRIVARSWEGSPTIPPGLPGMGVAPVSRLSITHQGGFDNPYMLTMPAPAGVTESHNAAMPCERSPGVRCRASVERIGAMSVTVRLIQGVLGWQTRADHHLTLECGEHVGTTTFGLTQRLEWSGVEVA